MLSGMPSKKKLIGTSRTRDRPEQARSTDPVHTILVSCTCWKLISSNLPNCSSDMPNMRRRSRMRAPTCSSTRSKRLACSWLIGSSGAAGTVWPYIGLARTPAVRPLASLAGTQPRHRSRQLGRRLPPGNRPRTLPGLGVVGDAGKPAAQFNRGRQFAVAFEMARISVASASVTTNIGKGWRGVRYGARRISDNMRRRRGPCPTGPAR
jgi:hypothetical protein